ncbi:N2,N2-dimethylguanosine tRNA methyltransferase [Fomitiporia mediterranea MF3/22]|uniref:N2,N2-dimethylguanosine tRNA methyltransferase n=1 Tax=Fomitiporia mediterranea (strain MF3/22) TaxID=694068 RepID=UPI0004407B63|nr:N2,N2-dimethylguanosine tRNA methyltransferase [Fomitiporia mediterranea MF3/22]EJD02303.1 N2,N2-dimethylguanosine tRNA methyltransferase [Fomitiporia mediterranea MF3/22]
MAKASQTLPEIPEGFTLHTEGSARILLPATDEAFLNPVQEFNRDLSVACIRTWSEELDRVKERKWKERAGKVEQGKVKRGKKKAKSEGDSEVKEAPARAATTTDIPMTDVSTEAPAVVPTETESKADMTKQSAYVPYHFTLLEPLSATGLRAIRYAKEIPLVKYVIANDLSPPAVEAIQRNVELNDLGDKSGSENAGVEEKEENTVENGHASEEKDMTKRMARRRDRPAKVRINEGDACALMYSHRPDRLRVDCVDLDPYGTAAPFIDAAVQCVNDGGLLCITCTDMGVLATNNYPEKCFSNYGGIPVKAEYCHEAALRLVLHAVSTSAARYGRFIHPLLSLSIDFYIRLFIRIQTGPAEVKKAASKTSTFYICSGCQAFYEQPLGKIVEKVSDKTGQTNVLFRTRAGPPVGDKCPECDSTLHVRYTLSTIVAGPMWAGPIHDTEFVSKALEHVEANLTNYGTAARMKGMLTVTKEELHIPFYFTPGRLAGTFHCVSPSLEETSNALLHAGFSVSRSHALAGSLKTNATRQDVHDVFRGWVKEHPVKPESIPPNSPSSCLHGKTPRFEANFSHHPLATSQLSTKVKLVRYQQNPTPNWGPGTRATGKRKRDKEKDVDEES